METIIIPEHKITLYSYKELSEQAKERVRQDLFVEDNDRAYNLKQYYDETLLDLFPGSTLKTEFSLSSSQGDGVNIYGDLVMRDFADYICGDKIAGLIKEDVDRILEGLNPNTLTPYMQETIIRLPRNYRYTYCIASVAEVADNLNEQLDEEAPDFEVLELIEQLVVSVFENICGEFEKEGYEYLYEPSEEEVTETCGLYEWLFYGDGERYDENSDRIRIA